METHLPTTSNPSDLQELCFGVMAIWFSSKQWDFSSKVWDFNRIYYMGIRMAKKTGIIPMVGRILQDMVNSASQHISRDGGPQVIQS